MNDERSHSNGTERDRGRPSTAGDAPGGQATGLRREEATPAQSAPPTTVGTGGAMPSAPSGGTGDSAGGLAEGPGGVGGTRVLPHGAGRPGAATSEDLPPQRQGADSPLDVDAQQVPDDAAGTPPAVEHAVRTRQRAT
jgi:hypothetical protein